MFVVLPDPLEEHRSAAPHILVLELSVASALQGLTAAPQHAAQLPALVRAQRCLLTRKRIRCRTVSTRGDFFSLRSFVRSHCAFFLAYSIGAAAKGSLNRRAMASASPGFGARQAQRVPIKFLALPGLTSIRLLLTSQICLLRKQDVGTERRFLSCVLWPVQVCAACAVCSLTLLAIDTAPTITVRKARPFPRKTVVRRKPHRSQAPAHKPTVRAHLARACC